MITYATMDRRSDRRCNPGFSLAGAIGDPPLSPSCNDHIAGAAAVTILGVYTVPSVRAWAMVHVTLTKPAVLALRTAHITEFPTRLCSGLVQDQITRKVPI